MKITIQHSKDLQDLTNRHPCFHYIHNSYIAETPDRRWGRGKGKPPSHDLQVIFIGKSGYGKSSLVNALIGKDVMQTSDVEACTRTGQCSDFLIRPGNYLSFTDVPGIGESEARDKEYMPMYELFIKKSDAIVYVLRADTRDYSIDSAAFSKIDSLRQAVQKGKVIIALNCCDKIEPMPPRHHRHLSNEQYQAIFQKVEWIERLFPGIRTVVPCSTALSWNIDLLANNISQTLADSLA